MSGENITRTEIDYLTEDTPVSGQEWGVYSFLSPEGIKGCSIRAFKNRGNFGTAQEASAHAEKIRNSEPAFHVFVGENFKWTAFDPDPNIVKDNLNYYEPKLQELMKGTLENQERTKQLEADRKKNMIEQSIKDELQKKKEANSSVRDRLKKKLETRAQEAKDAQDAREDAEDKSITDEMQKLTASQMVEKKAEVDKLTNNVSSIDENLQKMKNLYLELTKNKK